MGKDPAILFYTADFLTGTAFFTDEQRGQYIRLLCEQHQNGHIPESHMIDVCKSIDSLVVSKFKKDKFGMYFNQRMEDERLKRVKYSESRRKNRVKKTYDSTYDKHMSLHMENENEDINEDINTKSAKKNFCTLDDVRRYCSERKNGVDPERFYNYYESNGWMVGRNKMKDWKAAVRTWERNQKSNEKNITDAKTIYKPLN